MLADLPVEFGFIIAPVAVQPLLPDRAGQSLIFLVVVFEYGSRKSIRTLRNLANRESLYFSTLCGETRQIKHTPRSANQSWYFSTRELADSNESRIPLAISSSPASVASQT